VPSVPLGVLTTAIPEGLFICWSTDWFNVELCAGENDL